MPTSSAVVGSWASDGGPVIAYLHRSTEDDKKRLADMLHDELGGALTAAKMNLHELQRHVSIEGTERLGQLSRVLDEAVGVGRRAVEGLRPGLLDHLGLGAALEWHVANVSKQAHLASRCSSLSEADAIPADQRIVVYRWFEEALANIVGQGRSTWVEVSMSRSGDECRLSIRHDADDSAEQRPELCRRRLESMRHRALSLGGSVGLVTSPGSGTRIELSFPAIDRGASPRLA